MSIYLKFSGRTHTARANPTSSLPPSGLGPGETDRRQTSYKFVVPTLLVSAVILSVPMAVWSSYKKQMVKQSKLGDIDHLRKLVTQAHCHGVCWRTRVKSGTSMRLVQGPGECSRSLPGSSPGCRGQLEVNH